MTERYGVGSLGPASARAAAARADRATEPPRGSVAASPARHCLVDGEPSLLVEWASTAHGWAGRVVSVAWLPGVGWAMVERWLPAGRIEPVD